MTKSPYLLRSMQRFCVPRLNYSSDSSKKDLPNNFVIISEDMAVCWHPESKFPYECSKPLPAEQPEPQSILKMPLTEAHKMFSAEKGQPVIAEELAKLTYTAKHIWFPRARDKKAKKTVPDRPYL